jgi:hypothetical protein
MDRTERVTRILEKLLVTEQFGYDNEYAAARAAVEISDYLDIQLAKPAGTVFENQDEDEDEEEEVEEQEDDHDSCTVTPPVEHDHKQKKRGFFSF